MSAFTYDDIDIIAHRRRGGRVLGLCGGYQMLGRIIADPDGIEGTPGSIAGLGLLDVETIIGGDKTTVSVTGRHLPTGETVSGYIGRLIRADNAGGSMRVPMPDPIAKALDQSGVLCGPRGDQLR